jgi:hypothetical protein
MGEAQSQRPQSTRATLPSALGQHFFLPLLAIYPIVHMATVNPGQIALSSLAAATLVAVVAAVLLMIVLRPSSGGWSASACAAAFVVIMFFAYGPSHSALEIRLLQSAEGGNTGADLIAYGMHPWLSALWLAMLLLGLWAILRRWRQPSPRLISSLNVVAAVLMLFVAARFVVLMLEASRARTEALPLAIAGARTSTLGYNPDVYYIILDGYARADVLQRYYGFDNGAFLGQLAERGFRVNTHSLANYYWTFLSLASSLNMGYLQDTFHDALPAQHSDRTILYQAIRDNRVARFLRQRGYRFVHFQSTWGATLYNPYADEQVQCHAGLFQQEFFRALAEASWLKALQSRASEDLARCHLANLQSLKQMGAAPGPKFVFAHFVPPHHPYLFDRNGRIPRSVTLSDQFELHKHLWEKRGQYLEQLQFMNGRIIEAIDEILARSARPPIIVIQSDHGPQLVAGLELKESRRVRLANFAAFLLPGAPPELLPSNVSPVNEFRLILAHYFGADLPPLPDRHFYSSFRRPYAFEPVEQLSAALGPAHQQ